ncbi:hypothetical protein AVL50_07035 [Flammeovirga sp. SJP92]|nr:hypothetical protein AVL50_07035 [Flammeovirga sp. SJP92]
MMIFFLFPLEKSYCQKKVRYVDGFGTYGVFNQMYSLTEDTIKRDQYILDKVVEAEINYFNTSDLNLDSLFDTIISVKVDTIYVDSGICNLSDYHEFVAEENGKLIKSIKIVPFRNRNVQKNKSDFVDLYYKSLMKIKNDFRNYFDTCKSVYKIHYDSY